MRVTPGYSILLAVLIISISGFILFYNIGKNNSMDSKANIVITNTVENNIYGSVGKVDTVISNNVSEGTARLKNNIMNNGKEDGSGEISSSIENEVNETSGDLENNITNTVEGDGNYTFSNSTRNKLGDAADINVSNKVANKTNGNDTEPPPESPEIIWGIDSASETTENFYACVRENFGDPAVLGRYLETREDISRGLTPEQVSLIHSKGDYILPIFNNFNDATGYENGSNEAKEAIEYAQGLGIPSGVAIFADIEPAYPVDAEFIRGWFETISASPYESGIYGIFDPESALYQSYNTAVQSNNAILKENYVWTASPNVGITSQAEAPEYNPEAPEGSLAFGWQYGIDAETCNIDTNLFNGELLKVLWKPNS
ncbi:glycoside hydrolase domain-containing protein [Bacillus sp. AFS015802]|uniref:glycoside hydrolase domain-containing protein n=1 Tax=Bacillus sp. AFS015802 TaxID=2033486 RepID=UPI0015CEFD1C|nr:glycoside hydrolase domain-containing protein [Bacillus sp. AFS015802]